ncbi:MAG: ABC transporter ATP-binding protein, partial [Pseudomonadota bacterium]
ITSSLVLEGNGLIGEFVGGYSDWKRQAAAASSKADEAEDPAPSKAQDSTSTAPKAPDKKKLSYKLARELEQLPGKVEALESEIEALGQAMNEPAFFKQAPDVIAEETARAQQLQAELDAAYQRWEELEA